MAHFVVIGGGIAGLSAANALADDGVDVTLFEQSRELGGRGRTAQKGNYFLNMGPHALYRGGIAWRTFTGWKIPFSGGNPGRSGAASRSALVREKEVYPAVIDLRSLLTSRLFTVREKLEVARLLGALNGAMAEPGETVAQWMDRRIRSEPVRGYIATLVRVATYSGDFEHLSARTCLEQISMALKQGVLYLDGGWQTLVDGLANRARSLGVEICCEQRVKRLCDIRADGFVLAVDPETVERLTGATLTARREARVASLDLCLSRLPDDAPAVAFALDRPLYYSVHSAVARLALNGGALIHVMKYLREGEDDRHALRSELEEYADLVMPGWRPFAQYERFIPSLRVTAGIPGVEGRPEIRLPGAERVTVAGDWVGEHGMLVDAAVASALKAAKIIQQQEKVAA